MFDVATTILFFMFDVETESKSTQVEVAISIVLFVSDDVGSPAASEPNNRIELQHQSSAAKSNTHIIEIEIRTRRSLTSTMLTSTSTGSATGSMRAGSSAGTSPSSWSSPSLRGTRTRAMPMASGLPVYICQRWTAGSTTGSLAGLCKSYMAPVHPKRLHSGEETARLAGLD